MIDILFSYVSSYFNKLRLTFISCMTLIFSPLNRYHAPVRRMSVSTLRRKSFGLDTICTTFGIDVPSDKCPAIEVGIPPNDLKQHVPFRSNSWRSMSFDSIATEKNTVHQGITF